MEPTVISVSGKGGTGKTTLVALLLRVLIERRPDDSILVVDADPAANLPEVLGVEVEKTVGMVANKLKRDIEKGNIPMGISKRELLEAWVYDTLVELPDYDLLVMGRTEGEGCYCYVNSLLTRILDILASNYDVVLMDMEAGLEHISRRTDKDVDIMVIVVDPSLMSLKTAKRIKELIKEVHVNVKEVYLVGNRFPSKAIGKLEMWAFENGMKLAGVIPEDENIYEYNISGIPLLKLPNDTPALRAVRGIAKKMGLVY